MKKSINNPLLPLLVATSTVFSSYLVTANEFELSGKVEAEQRVFFKKPQYAEQLEHSQTSILIEPELYWGWGDGNSSLTFKPFYRYDAQDDERTHGDIRELSYIYASDDWEVRAGIRKEFWGVTEFQHLVDVINQTDSVEDIDGEDKLGQAMLNLSLVRDWGIVDIFVLPGFRERTFAGENGRLRGPFVVDTDNVTYESSDEDRHIDYALRWSHSVGDFDLGAYWFHGTNRDPLLTLKPVDKEVKLHQHYSLMDQIGVDVQATIGDWLYKFEAIYRDTEGDNFWASQAGFEYSFIGVFESNADLGLLLEYGYDSRGEGDLLSPGAAFQNDLFFGSRLALNDADSSELLMGFSADVDHKANSFLFEGSKRFGDNLTASLDVRLFSSSYEADQLYSLRKDNHMQFSLAYYY